jgi:hypothetical protein
MEVQLPDAGWLNGPVQVLFLREFHRESIKLQRQQAMRLLIEQLRQQAAAARHEAEMAESGRYA